MNKIKSIEINAFRAFKDSEKFDFINHEFNEVSNLIVLYAPNGSGKTSFIDAIEWGFTGKINRINGNPVVTGVAQQDKEYILKNKSSLSKFGSVKVTLDDDQLLEINTIKVNRRTLSDNKPGKVINSFENISSSELEIIGKKNILTHDQIDKFLRFQKPEEKYEALKAFWDKDNLSEKYQKLVLIVKEIEKVGKEFENEIKKIDGNLKSIISDSGISNKVQEQIKKYVSINGTMYLELKELRELSDLYYKVTEIIVLNQSEIDKNNAIQEESERLKKYFNESPHTSKQLLEIGIALSETNKQHEIFLLIKKNKESLETLKNKEKYTSIEIQNLLFLNQHSEHYESIIGLIKRNQQKIDELLVSKENIGIEIENIIIKNSKNKTTYDGIVEKGIIIEKNIERLKHVSIYKKQDNKIAVINLDKGEINKKFSVITKGIIELETQAKILTEYSGYTHEQLIKLIPINDNYLKNYLAFFEKLSSSDQINKDLQKNIQEKRNSLKSLEKMGSDLDKLKQLGYSLVHDSHTTNCPLCSFNHESYDVLISEIQKSGENLASSKVLIQEITILEEKKLHEENLLKKISQEIVQNINKEIRKIQTELQKKNQDLTEITIQLEEINKSLREEESILRSMDKILLELEIDITLNELEFENEIIKYIEEQTMLLVENKKLMEESLNRLKIDKLSKEELENKLEIEKLEINLLREKNSSNREIDIFKKYEKLLLEYPQKEEIPTVLVKLKEKRKALSIEIMNLEEEQGRMLGKSKYDYEVDIFEEIRKLENKQEKIKTTKHDFERKSEELYGEVYNSEKDYDIFSENVKGKNNRLLKEREILGILSELTKNFYRDSEYDKLRKKLTVMQEKKETIDIKYAEVKKSKDEQFDCIKLEIEKYFNLDIVNKIYKLIEPHPEFTQVDFKLMDDYLGLDIICKNESDIKESPILYFSSAQVNILSLSIFLAITIENTSALSTIIMDDPVQHLDSLNELSFIDLLRIISSSLKKQVIISTHSQQFFDLCKRKLNSDFHLSKFIDLSKEYY